MKTKLILLDVPDDLDTSTILTDLPRSTLFAADSIENEKLTDQEAMQKMGAQLGVAMYRAFAYRDNPDIYPSLKKRQEENTPDRVGM